MKIGNRSIGDGHPSYIISELSANHSQDIEKAKLMIKSSKEAGADAVKLQTYTPNTMTIDSDKEHFIISESNELWGGEKLYDLYKSAYTPWEWHEELFNYANEIGIQIFSTPFDKTAVDFLEELEPPAYKIASFEASDVNLVEYIAKQGRPVIMSTGLSSLSEIDESVNILKDHDIEFSLLHCISSYPAPYEDINLGQMKKLKNIYDVPTGFSDHTLGIEIPLASVAMGGNLVEKHFISNNDQETPDSKFSLSSNLFKDMVDKIRNIEAAIEHKDGFGRSASEADNMIFRRSVFAVKDINPGERFTEDNIRVIRPGYGLHPKYYKTVLGKFSNEKIERGTPITWDHL